MEKEDVIKANKKKGSLIKIVLLIIVILTDLCNSTMIAYAAYFNIFVEFALAEVGYLRVLYSALLIISILLSIATSKLILNIKNGKSKTKTFISTLLIKVLIVILLIGGFVLANRSPVEGSYIAVSEKLTWDGVELDGEPLDANRVSADIEDMVIRFNYYGKTYYGNLEESDYSGDDDNEFYYIVKWKNDKPELIVDATTGFTHFYKNKNDYTQLDIQFISTLDLEAWVINSIYFDKE